MYDADTIAAISTPPGRGGIGIVRLSGARSLEIAKALFRAAGRAELGAPNRAQYGRIVDAAGETVDTALLTYFKSPHSYTGEDVVELSCHGSPVILRKVLDMALELGARLAEPGEFTLRAFLNGRMDLAQAQAVRDMIEAQTYYQAKLAMRQLEGELSRRLEPIKQSIIEAIVHLESAVEFVEEDISPEAISSLAAKLEGARRELERIASSFALGRFVREGFDLAIVGRPNVGKSSVFNRLIGSERAIVTEIPGTTRDALYETTSISGVPVRLIDTAGIRQTADVVEKIGIERTKAAMADADIVLLVLDSSEPLSSDDLKLLEEVPPEKRIVVLNKSDLPRRLESGADLDGELLVSALNGSGFDRLTEAIFGRLAGRDSPERDDIMITDARQHDAMRRALGQIEQAKKLMLEGELEEVILLKLRSALEALGEITGETSTEDILDQIFSTFCIGK